MENLRRTVAVVEDDASMRRSVHRLLNASGFHSIEYASAEEFLRRDQAVNPDCLILDIDLGGMSGIDLQRSLKDAGSSLPVIFITALDEIAFQKQAERLECIAFFRKPFQASLLIAAIKTALGD
ncbi:response regulator transcription factor [Rhizobium tubonense]|uniref:Two-component system response regulator n=1 Tax=Rhizobium tubonense TaxID=484088 RepID=A0A2W4CWI9_9HYPH|nr:response regulator [Rhizobium tubonense]PZM14605.1 two-component system response regulator [Rhizobium tubonense]